MQKFERMKNKYVTQTCVFDLASRTILPKKINLKDYQIGHLSVGEFHEPVYVQTFDAELLQLTLLCKQGMFETLLPLVGSTCSFQFAGTPATDYKLSAVSLLELCFIRIDFGLRP